MNDDDDLKPKKPDDNVTDNKKRRKRLMYQEVDEYARELNSKYSGGYDYFKFYCKAIWGLGIGRIRELEGMCSDAQYRGHMLSKLIKDELIVAESKRRPNGF